MKILIALTYYRPHYSGLTIYAEREARALARRGHQVTVLTSQYERELPAREIRDGVEVIRLPVGMHVSKGVIMPSIPFWAFKLARNADVIHLHVPQLDAAHIALIGRLLRKPVVLTYHCDLRLPGGIIHAVANQVSHLANHIAAMAANVIVHNTEDYAENSSFLQRYLNKVQAILPPVELVDSTDAGSASFQERAQIRPGERIIGMVARLATEKGAEYLAQAMPIVLEKYPNTRVLYVGQYQNVFGEEAYAERLQPLVDRLGDHWKFLGILPDEEMRAFFQACDVFVLPSLNSTESFGMVQVEAMSCGAPVVSSNLPGVRVPVQMTGLGCIVPPANPAELAKAILSILDNPQKYRQQVGEIIQATTPESVAARYEDLFEKLIRGEKIIDDRNLMKLPDLE